MKRTVLYCLLKTVLLIAAAKPALADCRLENFANNRYQLCVFNPAQVRIALHLKNPEGEYYRSLGHFIRQQKTATREPLFAMNAGMYHPDWRPVGLYIENKQQIAALVQGQRGSGNFFIQPNGVFYTTHGKAQVTTTARFKAKHAEFATQSGPMLVVDGNANPRLLSNSTSRKIRNGVGVRKDGTVIAAISLDRVNFYEFAAIFKAHKAHNALYLDGTVSSYFIKGEGLNAGYMPLGPIFAVYPR